MIEYNEMIYSQEIHLLYNFILGNIHIPKHLVDIYDITFDVFLGKQNIGFNMYIFPSGKSHIIRNNKLYKLRCSILGINSLLRKYKKIIKSDRFNIL